MPDTITPVPTREDLRRRPRERSGRRGRVVASILAALVVIGVVAVLARSVLAPDLLSSTDQSLLRPATTPSPSAGARAGTVVQAGTGAAGTPADLGTVKGKYTLRGPSSAPKGSWAAFALTGPKKMLKYDLTAPFRYTIDTTKFPNGTYTLSVMVVTEGSEATTASRTLTIKNPSKSSTDQDTKTGSGSGGSSSGGGTTTSGGSSVAAQVVSLTNKERAKAGCGALSTNAKLTSVAQAHSVDMAKNNYFDHNSQNGDTPFDRMKAAGYSYRTAAENIAKGQRTAADVMDAWMNSEGHRANILNCGLTQIGVGYTKDAGGTPYWTQDFGTPM
ncbi:CAP domain-containing protein [Spongisporangium articulatum]|uniref:CAP domain-containing protein n=1 Tax=Spongisporangium articulatum TaxID=3362603 RepID=A0ABW8AL91_9ACTN